MNSSDVKPRDGAIALPNRMVHDGHEELPAATHGDTAALQVTLRGRGNSQKSQTTSRVILFPFLCHPLR